MKPESVRALNPTRCLCCGGALRVTRLRCERCGIGYEGEFCSPRLARLEPEQRHFAEQFILAGGNLRRLESRLGLSYPTLRNRLDRLIEALENERRRDRARRLELLRAIEQGSMKPEEGMRLLDALEGMVDE